MSRVLFDGEKAEISVLFEQHWSMAEIARKFHTTKHRVKAVVDPEGYRKRNVDRSRKQTEEIKAVSAGLRAAGVMSRRPKSHYGRVEKDALRLIKLIPPDTRDLTARLLGDPIPGRSALDEKKCS